MPVSKLPPVEGKQSDPPVSCSVSVLASRV